MSSPGQIYKAADSSGDTPLYQGEVLSGLVVHVLDLSTVANESPTFNRITHPYAVILTQWCDLTWDHQARLGKTSDDKKIPSILFCEIETAQELKDDKGRVVKTESWNRIKINKDERYHFLEKVLPECDANGEGLPELGLDFKRYFTLPTAEVYHQIRSGSCQRRVIL